MHTTWSGGLRWPMMVVACSGANDSGSGHCDLVMGFGFEDEELRGERGKTEEKGGKKVKAFFFF